jgi:RNA polymerase-binding transcription factor DksA
MRQALNARVDRVMHILGTRERSPGYVSLKSKIVLPHLRRAIEKTNDGTFGYCDDCNEKIPASRHKAVPGAIRCVLCQGLAEQRRVIRLPS